MKVAHRMKACEVVWSWIPCACPQPHRRKCSRVRDAPLADVRLPEEKRAGLQKRSLLTYSTVSPQWNAPSPKEKLFSTCRLKPSGKCKSKPPCKSTSPLSPALGWLHQKKKKKKDNKKYYW